MPLPSDAPLDTHAAAAVVVTYHPDAGVLENLAALHLQIQQIVVVDNGSGEGAVAALRQAAATFGFTLVENGANLGIASALNIGVQRALNGGAQALFVFDQDSTVTAGFCQTMLQTLQARALLSAPSPLGLLVPSYEDRLTQERMPVHRLADGSLATALTSGTLLSASTWHRIGPFADELFIDSVDHEYCLRVRKHGGTIECCAGATLLHSLGSPRLHSLLGFQFASTNHSPLRRYYQERNKLWMYRHYFRTFPAFCSREMVRSVVDLTKLLLVEDNKREKVRFFLKGLRDGLAGRMGSYRGF